MTWKSIHTAVLAAFLIALSCVSATCELRCTLPAGTTACHQVSSTAIAQATTSCGGMHDAASPTAISTSTCLHQACRQPIAWRTTQAQLIASALSTPAELTPVPPPATSLPLPPASAVPSPPLSRSTVLRV